MILVDVKTIESYNNITFEFPSLEEALPFMTKALDACTEDVKIIIKHRKEDEDGNTV